MPRSAYIPSGAMSGWFFSKYSFVPDAGGRRTVGTTMRPPPVRCRSGRRRRRPPRGRAQVVFALGEPAVGPGRTSWSVPSTPTRSVRTSASPGSGDGRPALRLSTVVVPRNDQSLHARQRVRTLGLSLSSGLCPTDADAVFRRNGRFRPSAMDPLRLPTVFSDDASRRGLLGRRVLLLSCGSAAVSRCRSFGGASGRIGRLETV